MIDITVGKVERMLNYMDKILDKNDMILKEAESLG